jgi:hypothetical protein
MPVIKTNCLMLFRDGFFLDLSWLLRDGLWRAGVTVCLRVERSLVVRLWRARNYWAAYDRNGRAG